MSTTTKKEVPGLTSGRKSLESFGDIPALQPILEKVMKEKELQLLAMTESRLFEIIVMGHLSEQRGSSYQIRYTRLVDILNAHSQHERDCFIFLCRLALVQTQGHNLSMVELSNELLQKGYASVEDLMRFGLIENKTSVVVFIHKTIEIFLAAVNLLYVPIMEVSSFLKRNVLTEFRSVEKIKIKEDCSEVMHYFFGLANSILGDEATAVLQNLLKFMSQYVDKDSPVIDNDIAILIINCLYQAQADDLCNLVHHECFKRHIFGFNCITIDENIDSLSYYLLHTTQNINWVVYCSDDKTSHDIARKLAKDSVIVKVNPQLTSSDRQRIIISNRNLEYLINVLVPSPLSLSGDMTVDSPVTSKEVSSLTSTDSVVLVSEKTVSSISSSDSVSQTGPEITPAYYGYLTIEQFESGKKAETSFYYNMVKDLMYPQLQLHCPTLIRTQYRKNDHIWFSFTPNMRHHFYESVRITPVVPMHWVKVPQPDGSPDLEESFREKALTYQTTIPQTSSEIAELVVLNSHRFERISITPPSGGEPVMISLYAHSEPSEQGEIGCDYLMDEYQAEEDIRWKKMEGFDIRRDEQIGRELPLPAKKGTESAEITTSTAVANLKETATRPPLTIPPPRQPPGPYHEQILGSSSLFARPLGEGPDSYVTEQQIKRYAMEGFDRPGFCFYGDGDLFQIGYEYTLPDQLPHTRTLREGGNGTVLEVYYEGTFYAVKRTAFRWREILIMPKLRHPNILRLVTMLMGEPMKQYPRRRNVFQYFPRMTNDLGRLIGSYEKYCLRTLNERYRNEKLLLTRIQENFKFVAREILQGLHYLHTLPSPIVHRDVKPSNILVKTDCGCANPLVCVCRTRPIIVLSDFDASLELSPSSELVSDPSRGTSQSYYSTSERLYHISPVGTMGFKSPEGFMHMVGNSLDIMPHLTTKADIFSFGLLLLLLYLNEDGPRHLSQVGTLLMSLNQTVDERGHLTRQKIEILRRSGIAPKQRHITVVDKDIHKIIPINRLRRDFKDMPSLVNFMEKALTIDPIKRSSARNLLDDKYLEGLYY